MIDYVIELDHVTKRFGDITAVAQLSLRVPEGTIYGFLGPNGAGKTTTIRMIMSIFYPDEGSIRVLGHHRAEDVKDRLGYLPEERGLYKKMKVLEILVYFARLKGIDRATARKRALTLLERFNLGDWASKPCESLSKGMSQKVQILATLVHDPEVIILDEPFSGLDPVNRDVMRDLILEMKRQGRTIIFSTHIMEQAEQICDYIFLINQGRKILDGPLSEVKRSAEPAIHLDYDGDGSVLRQIPGLKRLNDSGKHAEIVVNASVDPQDVLRFLIDRIQIRGFVVREPSLHEIFIRAVGGA